MPPTVSRQHCQAWQVHYHQWAFPWNSFHPGTFCATVVLILCRLSTAKWGSCYVYGQYSICYLICSFAVYHGLSLWAWRFLELAWQGKSTLPHGGQLMTHVADDTTAHCQTMDIQPNLRANLTVSKAWGISEDSLIPAHKKRLSQVVLFRWTGLDKQCVSKRVWYWANISRRKGYFSDGW